MGGIPSRNEPLEAGGLLLLTPVRKQVDPILIERRTPAHGTHEGVGRGVQSPLQGIAARLGAEHAGAFRWFQTRRPRRS